MSVPITQLHEGCGATSQFFYWSSTSTWKCKVMLRMHKCTAPRHIYSTSTRELARSGCCKVGLVSDEEDWIEKKKS